MKVKWTECAGRIIESGQRPRFVDFLQFLKHRATLVNNEFGEGLNCSPSKDKEKSKGRDGRNRPPHEFTTMAEGARNDRSSQHKGSQGTNGAKQGSSVCSDQHGVWRCGKFKGLIYPRAHDLPYQDKMKTVQENSLCTKCLNSGHYARICPKTNFKCQKEGCNKEHNTLLHQLRSEPDGGGTSQSQVDRSIVYDNVPVLRDEHVCPSPIEGGRLNEQPDNDNSSQVLNEQFTDELAGQKDANRLLFSKAECEIHNKELNQQLERL